MLLDEALQETFPASDPIAVSVRDAAGQRPRDVETSEGAMPKPANTQNDLPVEVRSEGR